jgi:hypothetical protein
MIIFFFSGGGGVTDMGIDISGVMIVYLVGMGVIVCYIDR